MLKKCMPLWREAGFQVKMYKALLDHFWKLRCRKVHAAVARSRFPSQKGKNCLMFRCYFVWQEQGIGYLVKSEQDVMIFCSFRYNQRYITAHSTPPQLQIQLYTTTVHCTTLITLITLHYPTLHSTTLHYSHLRYNCTTSSYIRLIRHH